MRILPGAGSDLAIHDLSEGTASVLMVHASGFHGRVWRPVAERLTDAGCIAVDLRGHGYTPAADDAPLTWDAHARDVLSVLDVLDGGPWWGVGHSMGGAVLMLAEQARPDTFAGLWCYEPIVFPSGLLDVAGSPDAASTGAPPRNEMAETARNRRSSFASFDAAHENFASKPPLDVFSPDALEEYVRHGFEKHPDGSVHLRCRPEIEARAYEVSHRHDAYDHLAEIGCPTVIARGGRDGGAADVAALVAARIPHAALVTYDDLGHFGPAEDPPTIAAAIDRFISSAGGSREVRRQHA